MKIRQVKGERISISGRVNSICKGPEVERTSLVPSQYSWSKVKSVIKYFWRRRQLAGCIGLCEILLFYFLEP